MCGVYTTYLLLLQPTSITSFNEHLISIGTKKVYTFSENYDFYTFFLFQKHPLMLHYTKNHILNIYAFILYTAIQFSL